MERRLDELDIVAIIIDGKRFKDDEMIIVLGVTAEGKKVLLGFIHAATQNASVCKEFLNGLPERGLTIEEGLLCVMDDSKGIRKAVEEIIGRYAVIRKCQWHTRENLVNYLPKGRRATFRKLLQEAYEEPIYQGAKMALKRVKKELSLANESAVRILEEGLEQTLTLHRLGLFEKLGKGLKTTKCIESIVALIGQRTDKVDYWRNSNQKQQWLAAALLDIEPRLNRIGGYRYLPELRTATQNKGEEGISCVMDGSRCYRISTKNGIDSTLSVDTQVSLSYTAFTRREVTHVQDEKSGSTPDHLLEEIGKSRLLFRTHGPSPCIVPVFRTR